MRVTTPPTDPRREAAPRPDRLAPPGSDGAERGQGGPPAGSREALLAAGLGAVRARLAAANLGRPAGAAPAGLLPVTKSLDVPTTLAFARVLADGLSTGREVDLGENRASDLEAKAEAAAAAGVPVRWHFIGHVQRNKLRRIMRHASVVHSVDSLALVDALARAADELGRTVAVYVQVDFTGEATKTGLDEAGARAALLAVAAAPRLVPLGLMAMGPLVERSGYTTADVFARVAALAHALEHEAALAARFPGGRCALSLGMSGDLELAVAAGSSLVRIGTDLFAPLRAAEPAEGHETP